MGTARFRKGKKINLMNNCNFPLCKYPVSREGFCLHHAKYFAGAKVKEPAKKIPIKSAKRISEEKLYKKIVNEMMAASNKCELQAPGCQIIATGLHHQKKRAGKLYLDRRYLKRSCTSCNNFCEQYPLEAIKQGYSLSKF